jgi:phosphonoacetaldehyde hydrolase
MRRIRAVIFDWAGTAADFGSCAPVAALQSAFEKIGVPITQAEARKDMGLFKRDHIAAIVRSTSVCLRWREVHQADPTEADIDRLYSEFLPLQRPAVAEHSQLIPGLLDAVTHLRSRGIRIGSTTGYTRELLQPLLDSAAKQGYVPDCVVTPDQVPAGRPAPYMIWRNLTELGVYPADQAIKIGDTPVDIEEGRNAGVWTVAVAATGNEIGMDRATWKALSPGDRATRTSQARQHLEAAKPDLVIDDLSRIAQVLDRIQER